LIEHEEAQRPNNQGEREVPTECRIATLPISGLCLPLLTLDYLDHAGGREHFIDTNVPIYVHEEEIKHAYWAVATGADLGVYLGHYMLLERLNWNTFVGEQIDIFQGSTLHHAPGHSPGLCMLQINLEKMGRFCGRVISFMLGRIMNVGIRRVG
jgi:hypothetical protein